MKESFYVFETQYEPRKGAVGMREIKFRAWDKTYKHFHEGDLIRDYNIGEFIDDPDYEVSQYTGLKDKKGVDIYESDIYENVHGVRWVIYYDDDVAGHLADAINRDHKRKRFSGKGEIIQGEVIGNIYENPELLEVTE